MTGDEVEDDGDNDDYGNERRRREQTNPQLEFWRKMAQAKELLNNTLDVSQVLPPAAVAARWCSNAVHAITKRGRKEGKWNPSTHRFQLVETIYLKLKLKFNGNGCSTKIRTYCSCNPSTPMCAVCFGLHINDAN